MSFAGRFAVFSPRRGTEKTGVCSLQLQKGNRMEQQAPVVYPKMSVLSVNDDVFVYWTLLSC